MSLYKTLYLRSSMEIISFSVENSVNGYFDPIKLDPCQTLPAFPKTTQLSSILYLWYLEKL